MSATRPFFATLLAVCGSVATSSACAGSALANTSVAFDEAMNRGDIAAVVAMYSQDGELLPPNGPRVHGRAAIAEYFQRFVVAKLTVSDSDRSQAVAGNLAYKAGEFVIRSASGEQIDHGKWLEVWRREHGRWLMLSDMWNSDLPPPQKR